ncbi:SusD/RagB family nutrient-binding outer membrane lipoprotein [Gillisia hiemivivida]|uniref:SusD/RagB family nutrient-binding outer membrane lipoprotein n=1 Tax=Gillisia hiemivivida TaxID=291190 RepID=A0A5C6ZRW5_9FLAO|nr:SusD/RagB family nutrient-binding outer membrane lipoprotein [Gillisia hiemivivida]TXD93093.1 SusD/RagB family nutrient-binding outer membrane lipoprotein [Gillisia hiemivivida]
MKKYFLTIIALATLWSCQTDERYENLNRDPKNPTQVKAEFLFTAATNSLSDQMTSANVNTNVFRFFAQYLTTTTYLDEPNYVLNQRNIPQNHSSELYRDVIFDLQNAKAVVEADTEITEAERSARLGQIEVLEVYAWSVQVDTFGDVPYTQAINAEEFPSPVYDDAATIYADLISRLNAVGANIQAGQGFTGADILYNGDMEKWNKFANSLQLRLGMRLSDVNPTLSKSTAEAAIAAGVFKSNEDNAQLVYQSNPPRTNPLWVDLVQSGRADYLPSATIVDIMNDLDDPRRATYFFNETVDDYIGGVYGGSNNYGSYSHVGEVFLDPTLPGILLDYVEVEFNLTKAADLGYTGAGVASAHYNAAITASIEYWGGNAADATAYLAQPSVAYDGSNEQFATQFWIAMFNNSFEGWSVWRKYDAPALVLPEDSGSPVPLRYTYPVNEQNLNLANYEAASAAIGGDDQQTPIFWDVN